jgi:quinoprotein dehydrogenase-associated probable ABC transporter substrate-binding protein
LPILPLLRFAASAALMLALAETGAVAAQPSGGPVARTALRVCADPNNLPFSDQKGEGFENKIATRIGRDLSLPVQYFWYPQVIGFVRVGLKGGRCDLVIGTVEGDDLMQTTAAYYRTGYMLVFRRDKPVSANLDDPALKALHIGVISGTPPSDLLVRHGLMANARPYPLTVDTRYEQPAHQLLLDVVSGKLDAGMIWGPFAGYYIKHDKLPLAMVQLHEEHGLPPLTYRIAMGTRYGEPAWHRQIEDILHRQHEAIIAILRDYGVPLLDDRGRLVER